MRKCASSLAWLLLAAAARAQGIGDGPLPLPSRLVRYLELSRDQVFELGRLQLEWQRYLLAKERRVAQVERELRDLTLAPSPDPYALGVRYVELEAICREARDTEARIRERARKVLNDAQRTRLGALEQAYRLLPEIAEADLFHLIDAPLPGLNLSLVGPQAPRGYPGCRYLSPAREASAAQAATDPENEPQQPAALRHPAK